MSKRPDKDRRKELLRARREAERAAARAKIPLADELMQGLFDHLSEKIPQVGCDHTHRLTTDWIRGHGLPVAPVLSWLHDNGGHCDCEALANAEERWQDCREE